MKRTNRKNRSDMRNFWLSMAMFTAFTLFLTASAVVVRERLLQDAQDVGDYVTRSYSNQEQNQIRFYEEILSIQAKRLKDDITTLEESTEWLAERQEEIRQIDGEDLRLTAFICGTEIGQTDLKRVSENVDWVEKAQQAGETTVFTGVAQNDEEKWMVFSRQINETGDVLALWAPVKGWGVARHQLMPMGSVYFLCAQDGTVLYSVTDADYTQDRLSEYAVILQEGIADGSLLAYDTSITAPDGKQHGVYYHVMENGWVSVLTIPIHEILYELETVIRFFFILVVLFAGALLVTAWRDGRKTKKLRTASETVQALGELYYAIYRVDYETGMFETLKCAEDMKHQMPKRGSYESFLCAIENVIGKETYAEFEKSFSLENIRHLVQNQKKRFGGDYLRRFGEELRWVNVEMLFDKHPGSHEVVFCFREIDMEKRRQIGEIDLLTRALETEKEAQEAKIRFFNRMSHEMRTPLNAVIGMCSLLRPEVCGSQKASGYIDKMEFAAKQLLSLINDLLEISRMEKEKFSLDCKPMNLHQCIKEYCDIFYALAQRENRRFNICVDIQHENVMGDSVRLGQILNNLLSNAFKYTKNGGSIRVHVQEKAGTYRFEIADNGVGMSKEFLEHVFEPYARETRFATRQAAGTGLGMAIVRQLVQQMNGEIHCESELGKGSCFIVELPLAAVETTYKEEVKKAETKQETPRLDGIRILLAEDDPVNIEIATEILSSQGAVITQARDGQQAVEAFEQAQENAFDVLLLDMQMPVMGGCEAARSIRALGRSDAKSVPMIAVTANTFAEDIAMTKQAGMDDHVAKPIDFANLCRVIDRFVHREDKTE